MFVIMSSLLSVALGVRFDMLVWLGERKGREGKGGREGELGNLVVWLAVLSGPAVVRHV